MSKLVHAKNIYKSYFTGAGELPVITGVDFKLNSSETVAIYGESGSGKSTLLHMIGLIDTPDRGELYLDGNLISNEMTRERKVLRNRFFGFVFQFYHLLPEFNALENIIMPAIISGEYKHNSSAVNERAVKLLADLGLEGRGHHKPSELSGGEQQRVAIGRALINEPKVILADEPTGNLDRKTSDAIMQLLLKINKDYSTALVIVTHSSHVAELTDKSVYLKEGHLSAQ